MRLKETYMFVSIDHRARHQADAGENQRDIEWRSAVRAGEPEAKAELVRLSKMGVIERAHLRPGRPDVVSSSAASATYVDDYPSKSAPCSKMCPKSLADHWQIRATIYPERVEEIHLVTDRERNIRRQERKVVWHRKRSLGSGAYGEVQLEFNEEANIFRAVKRITTNTTPSHRDYPEELKALLEFSQPKHKEQDVFIEFLGWFQHGSNLFLAMEYIEKGDLEANLAGRPGKVNEAEAQEISGQILLGLKLMHAEGFAHRDLKPQNILVVRGPPGWWVKLADFGLSKRLVDREKYLSKAGTRFYQAPEILWNLGTDNSSIGYTDAVDLWAMGCIAYRLVTGIVPFPSEPHLIEYCKDESLFPLRPLLKSRIGDSCTSFIRALLTTCPKNRPSSVEALDHTWIASAHELPDRASSPASIECALPWTIFSNIRWNTETNPALKSRLTTDNVPSTSSRIAPSASDTETREVGLAAENGDELLEGTQAQTQHLACGETLVELQNLAVLLADQGKYEEAEPAYRRLVAAQRQALGAGHQHTLKSMNGLANTLFRQAKYEEAEKAHRDTLAEREQMLGPRHPDTLTSMNGLAGALYHQYKYGEAEAAYRATLLARKEVLGEDHRDTLTSMSNLAKTLFERHKFKAAEEMYWTTLAARRHVLGRNHKDTLTTMNSLANTLRSLGHYQDAEKLHRETWAARQEVLGLEHPDTLTSLSNVADSLCCQNKFKAAEELYLVTFTARQKVLGRDHPDTLTSLSCFEEVKQRPRRRSLF
ncbi:hypothetical protein LLEC1_04268 [Akanthomyces lecanii]|uniref:Protein kinase domain-containing protein n=1 Tax=Cordyceps confragosa TaxID=2714763 RepID=A0A179I7C9_CORDF|nr:hypothetical protein LLEC1_04268 [Akanthomyces lecanii]